MKAIEPKSKLLFAKLHNCTRLSCEVLVRCIN